MSRKFGGRLIRIMMTKSSSCDILKKKRTIRRGSGSRPKGSYLMDLRFWNYVIPDGSTTVAACKGVPLAVLELCHSRWFYYFSLHAAYGAIVLELCHSRWFYYKCCPAVLQPLVLELCHSRWFYYHVFFSFRNLVCFGTMSFQMVLLLTMCASKTAAGFGTMSFQMVLLLDGARKRVDDSFGTMSFQMVLLLV